MERTDIENMRQIPIADFLARLGHEPVRRSGNELWYRAPYRSERTPSFRVNVAKQLWYDFGLGKGGDIFTLVGEFTRSGDFMAQARFIAETARMPLAAAEKPLYLPEPSEPAFEGVEAVPLLRSPLTEYLKERGIPYAVASRHCCRLNYGVRGKRYFAVGFPNVSGGYETRSRRFKGCVPPKDVSLIKAEDTAYHAHRSSGGSSGGMQQHKGCPVPPDNPSVESEAAELPPIFQKRVRSAPVDRSAFLTYQPSYWRHPQ